MSGDAFVCLDMCSVLQLLFGYPQIHSNVTLTSHQLPRKSMDHKSWNTCSAHTKGVSPAEGVHVAARLERTPS